jgi:hypothetical protein
MVNSENEGPTQAQIDEMLAESDRLLSILDPEGEREYDLHHKSLEEFVDFLGMLASVTVPSNIKPLFDPVELIQHYTALFLNPGILDAKFSEEIDRIFKLINGVHNGYGVPALLENRAIPLLLREACLLSMVPLHEQLLTKYNIESMYWFWNSLCNLWVGRMEDLIIERLDNATVRIDYPEAYALENQHLNNIVFEILTRILNIASPYCQHIALRALSNMQQPELPQVIEAYIASHPDLTSMERNYALSVTTDALYDITNSSLDEFTDYLFAHQTYEYLWEFDSLKFDPTLTTQLYIQLFNEPAFLFQQYSREQLERGFWTIQSCNLEIAAGHLLATEDIPLDMRLSLIGSIYNLFKDFYAVDSLETSGYMWWDGMISDYYLQRNHKSEESVILDAMLETLFRILNLESPFCRSAALHGLGHLVHPQKEDRINRYLDLHPELDEGTRAYAKACITGDIM